MRATEIEVLGDVFCVFSLSERDEKPCCDAACASHTAVLLSPCMRGDFSVAVYRNGKSSAPDSLAAAVAAAAFLVVRRGLPLDEITLETLHGSVCVRCNKDGYFGIFIPKCKEIYTDKCELFGCETEYTDVCMPDVCRFLHACSLEQFDMRVLKGLVTCGTRLPAVTAAVTVSDNRISLVAYNGNTVFPPSRLALCGAACELASKRYGTLEKSLFSEMGNCRLVHGPLGTEAFVKPTVYN